MDSGDFFGIQSRRRFFRDVGYGIGTAAIANLMAVEGRTADMALGVNR